MTGVEMIDMRQRKILFAVFALLLLLFAACKGESPTTPTTTPPTTATTGTTTPPTGASVVLTTSNANPAVGANVTITATVTQNGSPVPNGTAVQFNTTAGTFTDTGTTGTSVLKTTTNGVATATLTSGSQGPVTVTATVNNVSKSVTVTFSAIPVTPGPGNTSPTISSITPATGPPTGGETVTITGDNFRAPVRVVFTCEGTTGATPDPAGCVGQGPKDALVTSVTKTQITAIAPPFNVPAGKAVSFGITVFVGAGTSTETPVSKPAAIVYTSPTLTPAILSLSPTSGPVGGGTRITIFGDSFQAPLQVFFGSAEAQVISVNFSQIIVMSPKASDTAPAGSGTVVGPVDVRVRNINSGPSADATLTAGFRYIPKMQITTVGPTQGPITGGTHVTIDGTGFDDPLAVSVAGVAAQVIRVSGTEVVAITTPAIVAGCSNVVGSIVVTNTNNGDSASGPTFTFLVPLPRVVSATAPVTPGGTTTIVVLNASGIPRITIGGSPATITGSIANADGTTSFTVLVPTLLTFNTQPCPSVTGASNQITTQFDVVYTSLTTGCTDTFTRGVTVDPKDPILFNVPLAFSAFSATAAILVPPTPGVPAPDQTITFTNVGAGTITVSSVNGCNGGSFTRTSPVVPATVNPCDPFPVTVHYTTQGSGASASCTLTVVTNVGTRTFAVSGSTQ